MRFNSKPIYRWALTFSAMIILLGSAPFGTADAVQVGTTPGHLGAPSDNTGPNPANPGFPEVPGLPPRMVAAQERARNNERQKKLMADTDKLLALATELHADVARTDKNILSVDVVRRADEIEKLAHSVKERMRGQ